MNTTKLNKLTKITVIFYVILLVASFNTFFTQQIPGSITHYLNSAYPIAQSQFWKIVDTWVSYIMLITLFGGIVSVFFKKLFHIGKWLLFAAFLSNAAGSLIEPAYITYGINQFITEIYTVLQGVILVLLFIPREKTFEIELQYASTTKIAMNDKPNDSFGIKSILVQSWKIMKMEGIKSAVWWTFLVAAAVPLIFRLIFPAIIHNSALIIISSFVMPILITPFIIGGMLIGTKRCRGEIISGKSGFAYLNRWPQLAIANVIIYLPLVLIMFLLFKFSSESIILLPILFFYYIFITLSTFTLLLIADKKISIRCASIESFKKIFSHFPTVLLFLLTITLIFVLYAFSCYVAIKLFASIGLLLGILLSFWLVPYILLLFGVMYYQLFDKK